MTTSHGNGFSVRAARATDVRAIQALREPSEGKVLLHHDLVALFEKVQEFLVVEDAAGNIVAAGALHIMWEDLAEVRSIVVAGEHRGKGIGGLTHPRAVAVCLGKRLADGETASALLLEHILSTQTNVMAAFALQAQQGR